MYSLTTSIIKLSALTLTLLVTAGLSGCNQAFTQTEPAEVVSRTSGCDLPQSLRLNTAINEAKQTLQMSGCKHRFNDVFEQLLIAGKSDPGAHQAIAYEQFIDWSEQHEVITMVQAKDIYSRYFGTKFVSLKGDYSTCSSICKVKRVKLADMRNEYKNKELGLLKVLGDKNSFKKSEYLYNSMQSIINATCQSCGIQM